MTPNRQNFSITGAKYDIFGFSEGTFEIHNHKLKFSSRHSHLQEVTTNDTPLNSRQPCIVLSISNILTCFLYLNVKAELLQNQKS